MPRSARRSWQDKYDDAEKLYKRSLAIEEKVYGPDHPDVATGINNLAALLEYQVTQSRGTFLNDTLSW